MPIALFDYHSPFQTTALSFTNIFEAFFHLSHPLSHTENRRVLKYFSPQEDGGDGARTYLLGHLDDGVHRGGAAQAHKDALLLDDSTGHLVRRFRFYHYGGVDLAVVVDRWDDGSSCSSVLGYSAPRPGGRKLS